MLFPGSPTLVFAMRVSPRASTSWLALYVFPVFMPAMMLMHLSFIFRMSGTLPSSGSMVSNTFAVLKTLPNIGRISLLMEDMHVYNKALVGSSFTNAPLRPCTLSHT
ncbi:unnamed protein product [Ectocarpus sp. 13 AM-2016]